MITVVAVVSKLSGYNGQRRGHSTGALNTCGVYKFRDFLPKLSPMKISSPGKCMLVAAAANIQFPVGPMFIIMYFFALDK